jgi:hypothetical protein
VLIGPLPSLSPHPLLLNLAHVEKPILNRKLELRELVMFLDIPDELKQVPDEGIPEWAAAIEDYFESSLARQSRPGSGHAVR